MAFAVYENFEKGYGLCYNNKHRPPGDVISAVAVTRRPPPKCYLAVALGHCRNGIWRWPPSGIVFFFVQDLLLISSIVCCLLSMLQPRLIVYIVNKDFCRFNKFVTYLAWWVLY